MLVALAQINPVLGDFAHNSAMILDRVDQALQAQAELIVFPELSLFGYQPMDLLERSSVVDSQIAAVQSLIGEIKKRLKKNTAVVFGAITRSSEGKPYFNSAILVQKGGAHQAFHKELLPNYDVFDESRHFRSGIVAKNYFNLGKKRILVSVCEDIWGWPLPLRSLASRPLRNPMLAVKGRVDLVISLNASPFAKGKQAIRLKLASKTAKHFDCPVFYLNMVGGQDEQIYDGASFAVNAKGKVLAQAKKFAEELLLVTTDSRPVRGLAASESVQDLRDALVLGLRDFMKKTGGQRVHLGLSGGIDSAVVACLAAEALGQDRVTALALPGPYSAPESSQYARELAKKLGVKYFELSIQTIYDAALKQFEKTFGAWEFGVTHENLQSRARSLALMAYSNQMNSFLLSTSNKCELATGYSTLYGDMCGALAPLGDLLKSDVYDLAQHYGAIIPKEIIERPPTAELRPNQTDQDTLPPYAELDAMVMKLVEQQGPASTANEKKVLQMMYRSEFKRWQSPPILRVSNHGFGRGRRFPIAHHAMD
jgi:NAD+ synthase (glutamine-hydrolysing)